ncbi:MAG: SDR family oxidoreductase [Gammaproteobacteria bacterium]
MNQNVLITGANRGIGLALTKEYLDRGANVFSVCRKAGDELPRIGAVIIEGIDVTEADDIERLPREIGEHKIDLLINNAGILEADRLGNLDFDSILRQFKVNSLGPLRVTNALLPWLNDNARIAIITSRMGSISDNQSGRYYGYRMSKAALNIVGRSLACDLKRRGISVAILHPGFVRTEMVRGGGNVSPEEAAQQLAARIDELNIENSGTFWHADGEVLPW